MSKLAASAVALIAAAAPAQTASYSFFGSSCAGPFLQGLGRPVLGTSVQLQACVAGGGLVIVVYGISNTQYAGLTLPLDLGPWGAPGCNLVTSIDVIRSVYVFGPLGCTSPNPVAMPIPNNPALAGGSVYAQASMLTPWGPLPFTVSNGLSINLGY